MQSPLTPSLQVAGLQSSLTGLCTELVRAGSRLEPLKILQQLLNHPLLPLMDLAEVTEVMAKITSGLDTQEEGELHTAITTSLGGQAAGGLPHLTPMSLEHLLEDMKEVVGLDLEEVFPPGMETEDHQVWASTRVPT